MIDARWFNSMQKEADILQPEFFTPETHFQLYAELPEAALPIEINVSAFNSGAAVFEKSYIVDNLEDEREFDFQIDTKNGIITLRHLADTLENNPDRLDIKILTGENVYTESIVCAYATISGKTTDFEGNPFPAAVIFNARGFGNICGVWSDADGNYSITIPKGEYNSIFVDDNSYGKTSLEAWAWKMIIDRDKEHNFKIGNGEVYSLDVWTDNGGFPNLFVFFRPMILPNIKMSEYSIQINNTDYSVIDICPEIALDDIRVEINDRKMKNISLQKIYETGDLGEQKAMAMPAYILQIERYVQDCSARGKQTLILEYNAPITGPDGQCIRARSQGRTQFFYTSSSALALR